MKLALVQINAWVPSTLFTIYDTVFVFQKNVWFILTPGAVFMEGLTKVLGLAFVYKYSQLKPKTWLRPFVNMAPGLMPFENN